MTKQLDFWRHKLLDLGKRNKMIHFRETTRSTLRLTEPSFEELYERIAIKEESLTVKRPIDRDTDVRIYSLLSLLDSLSSPLEVLIGDIRTSKTTYADCLRTLRNMRAKARLAIEEQGTNILYLCFGFIEWKEGRGSSAQWIKSPLILVPAVLSIDGLNAPYKLSKHEDDTVLNPTLEYYLKTEYGIELPPFDPDKDSLDGYLGGLEEIADARGWRILREVSLGLLSFQKITMYNDLVRNEKRILENPVIRALMGDMHEMNSIPDSEGALDPDEVDVRDCYQVLSADSSQQEAILLSKKNVSFVMQGPPGTGKSQTITNIIAEALADGKKVLFVSEKMAALAVVYRRLMDAHLADFCLPLHSYKANKREILEQLGANLNELKQTRVKDEALCELDVLSELRGELNGYASELHKPTSALDMSCYEIYGRLLETDGAPTVSIGLSDPLSVSHAALQSYLRLIREYELSVKRTGATGGKNYWSGLIARAPDYEYKTKMRSSLASLKDALSSLIEGLGSVACCEGLSDKITYGELSELSSVLCAIGSMRSELSVSAAMAEGGDVSDRLKEIKATFDALESIRDRIGNVFLESIYDSPYNEWKDGIERAMHELRRIPLKRRNDPDEYLREYDTEKASLVYLKTLICNVEGVFADINDMLGTRFLPNAESQRRISELLTAICDNVILQREWFGHSLAKVRDISAEAKENAIIITSAERAILDKWNSRVFSLDYKPISERFDGEYVSAISRILNSQYRRDKRQLQELFCGDADEFNDNAIRELFRLLDALGEKKKWFTLNDSLLAERLGDAYKGYDSDWIYISSAVKLTEYIVRITYGSVPEKLIDLLCSDHSAQAERMKGNLAEATLWLDEIRAIIDERGISLKIDTVTCNAQRVSSYIDSYLLSLDELYCCVSALGEHLAFENVSTAEVLEAIEDVKTLSSKDEELRLRSAEYKELLGDAYKGADTDWTRVFSSIREAERINSSPIRKHLDAVIIGASAEKRRLCDISKGISDIVSRSRDSMEWLEGCFYESVDLCGMPLAELYERICGCYGTVDRLDEYVDLCEIRLECEKNGLSTFINGIEAAGIFDGIEDVFKRSFYYSWLGSFNERSDRIRRFRRNTQDERVRRFAQLDSKQTAIAQMRIRERLIEGLPTASRVIRATDEVSILMRELSKKRGVMPLRKLFGKIPNLLMKLKPCLMMSPLSVSYFLETDSYHFDMVIFDEASQIFPEDAIGAIFRGSQVIIAGDSKQLPPTSFFAAGTNGVDGDYDLSDEEEYNEPVADSILEAAASTLPNKTLRWHYRSKHESLIAFSNREIYKNSLITFPNAASNIPDMGVEYVYVEDGVYEGGGRNCNEKEAERCVMLVREHIEKYPSRSLGIIAFSEKQQEAIENKIIEFREENPELEWFFSEEREEPFFVKNLENVQGDERDTVIFSICYAKDVNGRMYMRFGPLGHAGGERRLNVAITRAKMNVKLVGSIIPSDIDLNRTDSEGVRMLRAYIDFARKGGVMPVRSERTETLATADDFCEHICKLLSERGYRIRRGVGCSDYKIDIAVEDQENDGEFIVGIECDGLSYVRSHTARDRDHLRWKVLENMGWRMYRVWSTEWCRNPQAEEKALVEFIEEAKGSRGCARESGGDRTVDVDVSVIADETVKTERDDTSKNPYNLEYYRYAELINKSHTDSPADRRLITENILHVLKTEQPIHISELYRRLSSAFPGGRATETVRNAIDRILSNELNGKIWVDRDGFARLLPLEPIRVRIPEDGTPPRRIEIIHPEEIAMAMLCILEGSYGIGREDLYIECVRLFGFERTTTRNRDSLSRGYGYLVSKNKVREVDGRLQLTGSADN